MWFVQSCLLTGDEMPFYFSGSALHHQEMVAFCRSTDDGDTWEYLSPA